jgi:peptidoglycan/LPS O-acetylase OafA/YrhL
MLAFWRSRAGHSMKMWRTAHDLATATPTHRVRYIDFLRALAILVVVSGHWLAAAPYMAAEGLTMTSILGVVTWSHGLTWVLQVMPVFFIVGGYANSASWGAALREAQDYRHWLQRRLIRLIAPAVPLVVVWLLIGLAAGAAGLEPQLIANASRLALVPTWFLAVYIGVILLVPVAAAAWRRFGLASFWIPVSAAVLVDALAFGRGLQALRWANYAFVWLAIHQLGFLWRSGRADASSVAVGWAMGGFAFLIFLIQVADYPVAMLTVPGVDFSNTRPPTVALIALAAMQFGIICLLRDSFERWLQRPTPWTATVLINSVIMTLFLWHGTVQVLLIGLAVRLGGIGLVWEPGSAGWWLTRPGWVGVMLLTLVPVVGVFARFEQHARRYSRQTWLGPMQIAGALLVCLGLSLLAWAGVGRPEFPWIRVLPLAATLGGAALVLAGPRRAT